MEHSIQSEKLTFDFDVVLSDADINAKIDESLLKNASQFKIPGFRAGKIPLAFLRDRFGRATRPEVIQTLLEEKIEKILKSEEVIPLAPPHVTQQVQGNDCVFSVQVDRAPHVIFPENWLEISLNKTIHKPKTGAEQSVIDQVLQSRSQAHPVDRSAKTGDRVLIDFEGMIDGVPFEGGSQKDCVLVLGSGQFIDGFESGLIGAYTGEEHILSLVFPAQYHNASLANQKVKFKVNVRAIEELVLPEFNDDFAKSMGFSGCEVMREEAKKQLVQRLEVESDQELTASLIDYIYANLCNFSVSPRVLEKEKEVIRDYHVRRGDKEIDEAAVEDIARRRVMVGVFVASFARMNSIHVTDEMLSQVIQQELATMPPAYQKQVVEYYQKNPEFFATKRVEVLEALVLRKILSMITIVEKEVYVDSEGDCIEESCNDGVVDSQASAGKSKKSKKKNTEDSNLSEESVDNTAKKKKEVKE